MKVYAAKASAIRAAKAAGLKTNQYELVAVEEGAKWGYLELGPEVPAAEPVATLPAVSEEPVAAPAAGETPTVAIEEPATEPTAEPVAEEQVVPKLDILRKSSVEGPTKKVWAIAEDMFAANPNTRRKDVIDECVKRGIAFYTARTQYQTWSQLVKAAQAAESELADKMAAAAE